MIIALGQYRTFPCLEYEFAATTTHRSCPGLSLEESQGREAAVTCWYDGQMVDGSSHLFMYPQKGRDRSERDDAATALSRCQGFQRGIKTKTNSLGRGSQQCTGHLDFCTWEERKV